MIVTTNDLDLRCLVLHKTCIKYIFGESDREGQEYAVRLQNHWPLMILLRNNKGLSDMMLLRKMTSTFAICICLDKMFSLCRSSVATYIVNV